MGLTQRSMHLLARLTCCRYCCLHHLPLSSSLPMGHPLHHLDLAPPLDLPRRLCSIPPGGASARSRSGGSIPFSRSNPSKIGCSGAARAASFPSPIAQLLSSPAPTMIQGRGRRARVGRRKRKVRGRSFLFLPDALYPATMLEAGPRCQRS
jgi:hypothetical protein